MTDSADADHTPTERTTRRALLGAGVIGAALAVAGSRPAAATTGLSETDLTGAAFAISLELTARDLYDSAIDAGAGGAVWPTMREQHESYAQLLAGISGISADARNDDVFDSLASAFDTSDPAAAAFDLENVAAATHIGLLGTIVDDDLAAGIASIVSIESRHATVLAGLSGRSDDFDSLFLNPATPLSPEG